MYSTRPVMNKYKKIIDLNPANSTYQFTAHLSYTKRMRCAKYNCLLRLCIRKLSKSLFFNSKNKQNDKSIHKNTQKITQVDSPKANQGTLFLFISEMILHIY